MIDPERKRKMRKILPEFSSIRELPALGVGGGACDLRKRNVPGGSDAKPASIVRPPAIFRGGNWISEN